MATTMNIILIGAIIAGLIVLGFKLASNLVDRQHEKAMKQISAFFEDFEKEYPAIMDTIGDGMVKLMKKMMDAENEM